VRPIGLKSLVVLFVLASAMPASAAEPARKHHPWARFSPGAWQRVRIYTETFDKSGRIVDTGVTEQKTTLQEVDDAGVTLQVEKSVWIADKRLDRPTDRWLDRPAEKIAQGLYGESEGQKATIKDLKSERLVIDGREMDCKVREVSISGAGGKGIEISKLYYSDDVAPFLLKRETTVKGADQKTVLLATDMVVDALDMPCLVADQLRSASHLRAKTTHAKGTTITLAYTSTDVPGGVVCQCTKELDTSGRLVRRTVMELTDCGVTAEERPRLHLLPRRLRGKWSQPTYDQWGEPGP
jgi:hypothetical protein